MNGYQQRTEKKKEQILHTTFELLSKYGSGKISVQEIARQANVSPVTLYNYFGSKEELIKASLLYFLGRTLERYEQILGEDMPFKQKLEMIVGDNGEIVSNMNLNLLRENLNDASVQATMEEFYEQRTVPFFHKLIAKGKEEGVIDPSLSMEAVMFYIQIFKETLSRAEFKALSNTNLLREINELLYFGLMGSRS